MDRLIVRISSIAFLIQLFGLGLKYGTEIIYAKILGPENYGVLSFVVGCINILTVVSTVGLTTSALKFIPHYMTKGQQSKLNDFVWFSRSVPLVICLLVFLLYRYAVQPQLQPSMRNEILSMGLLLLLPLITLTKIQAMVLQGFKRVRDALTPIYIHQTIAALALLLFFVVILPGWEKLTIVLVAIVTSYLVCALVQYRLIPRNGPSGRSPFRGDAHKEVGHWLSTSLPLFFSGSFAITLKYMDLIMLSNLAGDEAAGYYSAIVKTAGLIIFGTAAANKIVIPMISETWTARDFVGLERTVKTGILVSVIPGLCFALPIVLFGKLLLGLFGSDYVPFYSVLLLVVFGQLINALAGPVIFVLEVTAYQKASMLIYGFSAVFNFSMNLILIPAMGVMGAGITSMLTLALWNTLFIIVVKRKTGINFLALWSDLIKDSKSIRNLTSNQIKNWLSTTST